MTRSVPSRSRPALVLAGCLGGGAGSDDDSQPPPRPRPPQRPPAAAGRRARPDAGARTDARPRAPPTVGAMNLQIAGLAANTEAVVTVTGGGMTHSSPRAGPSRTSRRARTP